MNLKELYQIAKDELSELSPLDQSDFRLEQAEYNEVDDNWEIVVSYLVENSNKPISALGALSNGYKYYRMYKKVKISRENKIIGFYIYEKE